MKTRRTIGHKGQMGRKRLENSDFSHTPILPHSVTPILLAVFLFAAAAATSAPLLDLPETWDTAGNLAGWGRSESTITLMNPGGMLDISFRNQSGAPTPQSAIVQAGSGASGGRFTGNYSALVRGISFRCMAVDMTPSAMWLIFRSGVSSNEWYVSLQKPRAGAWETYAVSLAYSAGWTIGPRKSEARFLADLQNIVWVGLYIRRNSSPTSQHYYLDDFQLLSVAPVMDHGTKPKMDIRRKSASANSFEIGWDSVSGRKYGLWRSTNLVQGVFMKVKDRIDGVPPRNYQEDTNATGMGPYFYRVNVETN